MSDTPSRASLAHAALGLLLCVAPGTGIAAAPGSVDPIVKLAVAPDQTVFSGTEGGVLRSWSSGDTKQPRWSQNLAGPVRSLDVDSTGHWLAVALPGSIHLLDASSGEIKKQISLSNTEPSALSFHDDSGELAVCFKGGAGLRIWDVIARTDFLFFHRNELRKHLREIKHFTDYAQQDCVDLVSGQRGLTTLTRDGTLRSYRRSGEWGLDSQRKLVHELASEAAGLSLSRDGTRLLLSWKGSARLDILDPRSEPPQAFFSELPGAGLGEWASEGVAISVASPRQGETVHRVLRVDTSTGELLSPFETSAGPTAIAPLRGGRLLLATQDAGWFRLEPGGMPPASVDRSTERSWLVPHREGHLGPITAMALYADDTLLVTGSTDATIRLWDVGRYGDLLKVLRLPQGPDQQTEVLSLAISPDGARIAAGGRMSSGGRDKERVYIFERASGRLEQVFSRLPGESRALAFLPKGELLLTCLSKGGLKGFVPGESRFSWLDSETADMSCEALDLRSDGHFAALLSERQPASTETGRHELRLYQSENGRIRQISSTRVEGPTRPSDLKFSPDGRFLAVAWADTALVQVYKAEDQLSLERSCGMGEAGPLRGAGLTAWPSQAEGPHLLVQGVDRYHSRVCTSDQAPKETERTHALDLSALIWRGSGPIRLIRGMESGKWVADTERGLVDRAAYRSDFVAPLQADKLGLSLTVPLRSSKLLSWDMSQQRLSWSPRPTEAGRQATNEGPNIEGPRRISEQRSANGALTVAALSDGTLRWYEPGTGKERLALFHVQGVPSWCAWTPEGWWSCPNRDHRLLIWLVDQGPDRPPREESLSDWRADMERPTLLAEFQAWAEGRIPLFPPSEPLIAESSPSPSLNAEESVSADAAADLTDRAPKAASANAGGISLRPMYPAGEFSLLRQPIGLRLEGPIASRDLRFFFSLDAGPEREVHPRAPTRDRAAPTLLPDLGENLEFDADLPARDCSLLIRAVAPSGASSSLSVALRYSAPAELPDLYVLSIGVTRYQDPGLATLESPANDAILVADFFQGLAGRPYRKVSVKLLPDELATRQAILQELEELHKRANDKDLSIVYFAGHGLMDAVTSDYYFLPVDARNGSLASSVPGSEIRKWVNATPGKKLLLLDTCHAGAITAYRERSAADADALQGFARELRAAQSQTVICVAATSAQTAKESDALKGGVFTRAVLDGLSGKAAGRRLPDSDYSIITYKDLEAWFTDKVPEFTSASQRPFCSSPSDEFPLVLVPPSTGGP